MYISPTPHPRTSLKRSKKMIQMAKYMKSLSIMPRTCVMNETRYSMTESRLACQTARRNLSSFIIYVLGGRVAFRVRRKAYRDHDSRALSVYSWSRYGLRYRSVLLDQRINLHSQLDTLRHDCRKARALTQEP